MKKQTTKKKKPKIDKSENITRQQEIFVRELALGKTQREAYKLAYPKTKASDSNIDSMASRLFKKDKVQSRYLEIRKEIKEMQEKETVASAQEVMEKLSEIARADLADVIEVREEKDGSRYLALRGELNLQNVEQITQTQKGDVKIKMYSKLAALSKLADLMNVKEKDAESNNLVNEMLLRIEREEYGD